MIHGIGTDIVEIQRVARLLDSPRCQRFLQRCFTAAEIAQGQARAEHARAAFFAKRFAAKEAAAKALGTGIGKLRFVDIEVVSLSKGKPTLAINGFEGTCHLSLSDTSDLAIAYVIIEKA